MSTGRRLAAVVLLSGLASTIPVGASGPSFWTVATTADFLKGTSDGVYVSLSGVVTPAAVSMSLAAFGSGL